MPRQGSSALASSMGVAVIACTGVPMTIVELGLWKKFHGLRGGDKESG